MSLSSREERRQAMIHTLIIVVLSWLGAWAFFEVLRLRNETKRLRGEIEKIGKNVSELEAKWLASRVKDRLDAHYGALSKLFSRVDAIEKRGKPNA